MTATEGTSFLLDYSPELLEIWLGDRGRPAFHAGQVARWIFERRVTDFSAMTDLPQELRAELGEAFEILSGQEVDRSTSPDGTAKLLLRWPDGASTESVMIPADDHGRPRRTVCLSTQVGCDVGCRFCASGIGGVRASQSLAR